MSIKIELFWVILIAALALWGFICAVLITIGEVKQEARARKYQNRRQ
jgi:hypothetical protein